MVILRGRRRAHWESPQCEPGAGRRGQVDTPPGAVMGWLSAPGSLAPGRPPLGWAEGDHWRFHHRCLPPPRFGASPGWDQRHPGSYTPLAGRRSPKGHLSPARWTFVRLPTRVPDGETPRMTDGPAARRLLAAAISLGIVALAFVGTTDRGPARAPASGGPGPAALTPATMVLPAPSPSLPPSSWAGQAAGSSPTGPSSAAPGSTPSLGPVGGDPGSAPRSVSAAPIVRPSVPPTVAPTPTPTLTPPPTIRATASRCPLAWRPPRPAVPSSPPTTSGTDR